MRKFLTGAMTVLMILSVTSAKINAQEITMADNVGENQEFFEVTPEYATLTDSTGCYQYIVNNDNMATITKYIDTTVTGDVIIPDTLDGYVVSKIGNYTFEKCTKLEGTIFIPKSVTQIGVAALVTGNENAVSVAEGNTSYKVSGNALYNTDGSLLVYCWDKSGSFIIPDTVTAISQSAFANNEYITNITIGENVENIGISAFNKCTKLTDVKIPNKVITLGDYAFYNCTSLKSIDLGESLNLIGQYTFCGAVIDEVVIPANVKTISMGAFRFAGIKKLTIEEGVETISKYGFAINDFEMVKIPASVEQIGDGVFFKCGNLKEISVSPENEKFIIKDTSLVSVSDQKLLAYPIGNDAEIYQIPNGIRLIGEDVFTECKLKRIEMPKSLESLGGYAFQYCQTLEEIVVGGSITTISVGSFQRCYNLKSIYIPSSVKEIGYGAFLGCNRIENIYYVGSKEQWEQIEIVKNYNDTFLAANVNYMSNLRMFVERMYWDALGRAFDDYGLNSWVQMLVAGTHDGAGLAKEFVLGDEFAMRNLSDEEYVDVLYETFFDRGADETGKMLWMGELASGKSRAYVLSKFVNLEEFTTLCAEYGILRGVMFEDGNVATPGCVQFVGRLYDLVMGRDADNDGLYTWTFALTNGLANAQSVATQFFNGAEYAAANKSNEAYVTDLYGVFMDRTPDESGLAFWVSCLSEQGVSRDWVLSEFAKSAEFKIIAARFGIQ